MIQITTVRLRAAALIAAIASACATGALRADAPARTAHDYPTSARVEYVDECRLRNGNSLAALYQCSCAIDYIARQLSYDDYVEASTFVHGSADVHGEGGGIFRDPQQARTQTRQFRALEAKAYRACGLKSAEASH